MLNAVNAGFAVGLGGFIGFLPSGRARNKASTVGILTDFEVIAVNEESRNVVLGAAPPWKRADAEGRASRRPSAQQRALAAAASAASRPLRGAAAAAAAAPPVRAEADVISKVGSRTWVTSSATLAAARGDTKAPQLPRRHAARMERARGERSSVAGFDVDSPALAAESARTGTGLPRAEGADVHLGASASAKLTKRRLRPVAAPAAEAGAEPPEARAGAAEAGNAQRSWLREASAAAAPGSEGEPPGAT